MWSTVFQNRAIVVELIDDLVMPNAVLFEFMLLKHRSLCLYQNNKGMGHVYQPTVTGAPLLLMYPLLE